MKRCRQAVLRTTVLGRNGKTVIRNPLTNRSRSRADITSKIFHSSTNERRDILSPNVMPGEQSQIADEIGGSGDEKECITSKKRKINSLSNWKKIRDGLLKARVENASFREGSNCVACKAVVAIMRCEYCGPKQYFCSTCARDIHVERNKYHVLEQWQVLYIIVIKV